MGVVFLSDSYPYGQAIAGRMRNGHSLPGHIHWHTWLEIKRMLVIGFIFYLCIRGWVVWCITWWVYSSCFIFGVFFDISYLSLGISIHIPVVIHPSPTVSVVPKYMNKVQDYIFYNNLLTLHKTAVQIEKSCLHDWIWSFRWSWKGVLYNPSWVYGSTNERSYGVCSFETNSNPPANTNH